MKSRVIVLMIVVGTLLPAIASGEVIHLKNGNTLQGEVESTKEQEVTVNIPGLGTLTLKRDEIASIEDLPRGEQQADASHSP